MRIVKMPNLALSMMFMIITTTCLLPLITRRNTMVVDAKKAILGIDLGSLYMKVALVQRNAPLEIVTNLHSKRKTEQMILFDAGTRFYGADANSLLGRKPHLTPMLMSLMLGRDLSHPSVQVLADRHFPIRPQFNESRSGVCLTVNNNEFTPEELVAMVLTHAKDITAAHTGTASSSSSSSSSSVRDCVLTVPSFYTQHERRALLDAATLADFNVLSLIDETTAAALHYGIDRIDENPKHVLFYNLGASALQLSLVKYHSYERKESKYSKAKAVGSFEVISKSWDSTLGGMAFDARLVDYMADDFNTQWNAKRNDGQTKDVRSYPRPMSKLRIQANKVKHVLSANSEIPIYIDSLHDDISYQTHLTRSFFEELCQDLINRSSLPIQTLLHQAGMTLNDIDDIELIGGGMRIPRIQEQIRSVLLSSNQQQEGDDGEKENKKKVLDLGMHINSDESMALGAAFHGANVSTAFKVRHVGMTDINPFSIQVALSNLPPDDDDEEEGVKKSGLLGGLFGGGGKKKKGEENEAADDDDGKKKTDDDDNNTDEKEEEEEEVWSKQATVFKSFSRVGIKKTIAFTHDQNVHCAVDYDETDDLLPVGTELSIERYNITGISTFAQEMAAKGLSKPKIALQFELSPSGITQLIKAEAVVEEMVMVTEEVEVDEEDEEEEKKEEKEASETEEEKKTTTTTSVDDDESSKEGDDTLTDEKMDDNTKDKKKTEKKEKKTKTVEVEKKKLHKRVLSITSYHDGRIRPYSSNTLAESLDKLQLLAKKDKERIQLEESRNKVEGYIYHIKNKLSDEEESISKVSTQEQRSSLLQLASNAEDWLYEDGYDADYDTMEEKYTELSTPAEKIFFRLAELTARPNAIAALNVRIGKIEDLMTKWETTMPQVTEEERNSVLEDVEGVKKWIADMMEKQENADLTADDDPVFVSADVPLQTKKIEATIGKLSKKPKPKPVENKTETTTNNTDNDDNNNNNKGGEGDEEEMSSKEEGKESTEEEEKPASEEDDAEL